MSGHREFRPVPGQVTIPEPGLRRILAPNPSPMTQYGTNTYLVGQGRVAVIDPGPDDPDHLAAIEAALGTGETISHILVTHAHLDHSALAPALSARTGAPVLAFGDAFAGRSDLMIALAADAGAGGGEGVDRAFVPDHCLMNAETIAGDGWQIQALHTPGHFANHLSFIWQEAVFSGDHVMGWSSSLISPPDGDMGAYMASLDLLAGVLPRCLYPGHGASVDEPLARIEELRQHRLKREAEIRAALARGAADATNIATRIYTGLTPSLHRAAARNVFAHLVDLSSRDITAPLGQLHFRSQFRLTTGPANL